MTEKELFPLDLTDVPILIYFRDNIYLEYRDDNVIVIHRSEEEQC